MNQPEPIFIKFMRLQRATVLMELAANKGNLASIEQLSKEIILLVDEINHVIKIALEANGKKELQGQTTASQGNPVQQPGNETVKQGRNDKGRKLGRKQVQKVRK